MLVGGFTRTPQLQLSDQETKALTDALADVLDKHEINVTGGVSVELTLLMTVLMIEGPRVKLLIAARKTARQGLPEPAALDGVAGLRGNF